jgi:hypothetical protein
MAFPVQMTPAITPREFVVMLHHTPSLQAQRSNPDCHRGKISGLLRCARNDDADAGVRQKFCLVPRTLRSTK